MTDTDISHSAVLTHQLSPKLMTRTKRKVTNQHHQCQSGVTCSIEAKMTQSLQTFSYLSVHLASVRGKYMVFQLNYSLKID